MNFIKKYIKKKGLYSLAFPPGHYASAIPDTEDALKDVRKASQATDVADVDMNEAGQIELMEKLSEHINAIPFSEDPNNYRYHFNNSMFQRMDGSILYGIIKQFQPKNIIEIGSGFSSAMILDMTEMDGQSPMNLTYIEPYPKRLNDLLREKDRNNVKIIESKIQDVDLSIFDSLEENDILFLDTSHIVKTGGDVTYWTFNILPKLKKGVIIHIHDIFWPFEYSEEWIKEQRCYNETYLIRAFLMNNNAYKIIMFNSRFKCLHSDTLTKLVPAMEKHHGGGSLWIQKQ